MSTKRRHRGANEGSIYQRTDGRWECKISLGYRNGKRYRPSIYGETRAEVATLLNKALRDHNLGLPVAPERQKVATFLDRWLKESVRPSVRPLTYEQYAQHVRLYLVPAFGHLDLGKLVADHVQAFINRQLQKGLSPRTVQLSLATLKRALKQAERWALIPRNVALLVDAPRVRTPERQPLDPEQSKALLAAAVGERHEALFALLLFGGFREGEALGLEWKNIDFARRTIAVEQSLARIGRGSDEGSKLVPQEPKTPQSRRVVQMPDVVFKYLREQRRRQAEQRLAMGPEWREQGLVFTTQKGTPLEASNVYRAFKSLLLRAGLPNVRVHDLRHSTASLLLNLGVELKTIQTILGHSSIRITSDLYAHLAPKMKRDAADHLDKLFESEN